MIRAAFGALSVLATAAGNAMAGCGPDPAPCQIEGGDYHVVLPAQQETPAGIMLFLHGAGDNGGAVVKNSRFLEDVTRRGYVFVAPTASIREGSRIGRSWIFYPGWEGRDDTDFLEGVAQDVVRRFDLKTDSVLLAGFSAGGFMVNYLACATPDLFDAYAPVSGGFWRPQPEQCAGPVRLFQTHGWSDKVVPLEGRFLGGGRYQQGDIFAGLELWRQSNGCADHRPDLIDRGPEFLRRAWTDCAQHSSLEFALFPGGHRVPDGWADMVLDWFEALPEPEERG